MNIPLDKLEQLLDAMGKVYSDTASKAAELRTIMPLTLKLLLTVILLVACVNVLICLIKGVAINLPVWKPKPDSKLMYSFAAGSGQFQRGYIFRDARRLVLDRKWSAFSFAGLAYRLGNVQNDSKLLRFALSLVYVALSIVGAVEMVYRAVIGVITYFVLDLAYMALLFLLWLADLALIPLFNLMDKSSRVTQHCSHCYTTFQLPVFECPSCGAKHDKLYPGRCGLLWARCQCGHFLPCSALSRRKRLASYCPKCEEHLAASSVKSLTIQVVGGNSAGKTSFIAAFQHLYISTVEATGIREVSAFPADAFAMLEKMYETGCTDRSSGGEVRAYHILHEGTGSADDGLVFYDIPDELILSEQYERNPLNFGYSDGIIIVVDPLSVRAVREECETSLGPDSIAGHSGDPTEDIVVHFINKYSEVAGRTARKMSDVPVAVVITKADLTPIRRKIGIVKIKAEAANSHLEDLGDARNIICRRYLSEIGLANVLNNLDSVFSNVAYFPVSAIGHLEEAGEGFDPQGVIEPVEWIAAQCSSAIHALTIRARENTI